MSTYYVPDPASHSFLPAACEASVCSFHRQGSRGSAACPPGSTDVMRKRRSWAVPAGSHGECLPHTQPPGPRPQALRGRAGPEVCIGNKFPIRFGSR